MKTFYFLSGLPRSGSTLLTALLNQNPNIYASQTTDLATSMLVYESQIQFYESVAAEINTNSYYQVLNNMGESFYSHIDKPIVIDKSRLWGNEETLKFANLLNADVKIICTVRPILEILASFISIIQGNENNFIDKGIEAAPNFKVSYYRDKNDARCDWLMSHIGTIGQCLPLLHTGLKSEHKDKFFFIKYNDLVDNKTEALNSIYDFLNLPRYEHNFTNIKENDKSNDEFAFGVPNLHQVKPKLIKSSTNPEEVLSDYVIQKYKNTLDFTGLF
jgi:sulfotransferase